MRRILPPLALLLAASLSARASAQEGRPRALVIGITGYPHFEPEQSLNYADDDALAFANLIQTPEGGGFDRADIQLLVNERATREAILDSITSLGRNARPDDFVYVFFSGHGVTDDLERAFLMPYDADDDRPDDLGFPAPEFVEMVKRRVAVKQLVFFIDACYAGATFGNRLAKGGDRNVGELIRDSWEEARRETDVVSMAFLSARNSQRSWEDHALRRGVFSHYLLQGLAGAADTLAHVGDRDGVVTANELHKYLLLLVEAHVDRMNGRDQTPTTSPDFAGALPLYIGRVEDRSRTAREAFNLGYDLAQSGDTVAARTGYERAIELDSTYAFAYNNLGVLTSDNDSALALYRKAARHDPGYALAHYNVGVTLAALGRAEEAIEAYRQSIRLAPEYAPAHNNLGVQLQNRGEWDQAIQEYREAIRIDPEHPYAHRSLGKALLEIGDLRGGLEALRGAVSHYVADPARLRTELAGAEARLDSLEQRVRDARERAAADPGLWHDLGYLLHEEAYDFEAAHDVFERRTREHPDELATLVELAEASVTTARFEAADSLITELLARPELPTRHQIVLRALRIVTLDGMHRSRDVPARLEEIRGVIAAQPDTFDLSWTFAGTRFFVRRHPSLLARRAWLMDLYDALERGLREEVLRHLPPSPPSREVDWVQCQGDIWCPLLNVNLDHEHFVGMEGVYVVWRGGPEPQALRVGRGQIREALRALRSDGQILAETSEVLVTWARVAEADQPGVEKYLVDTLSPSLERRFLVRAPVAVNLPW